MEANAAAAAPFLKLFGTRGIAIFQTSVYFNEQWVLRARRKKRGQKGQETVHSSTTDVQLPTEFAEKVKLYWCREKRERFADSLQMEQVPRVILPRSTRHPLLRLHELLPTGVCTTAAIVRLRCPGKGNAMLTNGLLRMRSYSCSEKGVRNTKLNSSLC